MVFFLLFSLFLPLVSANDPGFGQTQITGQALEQLLSTSQVQPERVPNAEAVARAERYGISLPTSGNDGYWLVVKLGIGVPGNVNIDAEVFFTDEWTGELGTGGGLLGTFYNVGVHWRPDALNFGRPGASDTFSIGFGPDAYFGNGEGLFGDLETLISLSADLTYIHHFSSSFGIDVGLKGGAGPITHLTESDEKSDLGVNLMLYIGVVL